MAVDPERSQMEGRVRERMAADRRMAEHDRLGRADRPLDPVPPTPPDWRDDVIGLSGLNVLAGIWLIIAPWVLNYHGNPYWNDIVFGAIVGLLALVRISGAYRESWLSWINALIGVWIFISTWVVDNTSTAQWNNVILGAIVFVLAIASASATPPWNRRSTAA